MAAQVNPTDDADRLQCQQSKLSHVMSS